MRRATIVEQLPSELYGAIVDSIAEQDTQHSILSFTRALPHAPIPTQRLFRNITLKEPQRVAQFYNRIRRDASTRELIYTFSVESWKADADVVINILALGFSKLRELRLCMGPNFSPDHLEKIFARPIVGLELLSLRFRP